MATSEIKAERSRPLFRDAGEVGGDQILGMNQRSDVLEEEQPIQNLGNFLPALAHYLFFW